MSVVIVGGGQAGLQVADSLRAGGYADGIDIVADEPGIPYQRPPLSKDYLVPGKDAAPLPLRGPGFLAAKGITVHDGVAAVALERGSRQVVLSNGRRLGYGHLVLATGAANRHLACEGAGLPGIRGLRTLPDAQALHAELPRARNVVVIGAGFIGLEFAAAARAHGATVTVLEFAPRPMGRALSAVTAEWFAAAHVRMGVRLRLNEGIERFEAGPDGRVAAAVSTSGERYPADLVVAGIGVVPNDSLAAAAGLETANGIVVDEALRTSDPSVLAVGDCASFPNAHTGTRTRLESVQNATDQGRHAAGTIMGRTGAYLDLPWFWSVQGALRLQIAGLSAPGDQTIMAGDPDAGKFSVLCFRDGALAAVESVNAPADHIAARKLLAAGHGPTLEEAAARGFSLKAFGQAPASAGR
ncbi:pyridine nucleotide-disulfide oxidoreductase [Zafaria cholistanensis]|uniref:Pyridine nucleotide-disulfide oxidoreductase n=1 Tax=Zafaria cholistanensis TaxID=1682741 RepID=A0A5A7NP96_9MICC|nr:FAD-dependent oxidoreductase [Zafaria cholistanensis]GER22733.1 pyridine nucleotide-disulfide oxidoreductase [Zafaria cholistanensis]